MFESVAFLCTYLPQHLQSLLSQHKTDYSTFDPHFLGAISNFIRLSKNLFDGATYQSMLGDFLIRCFLEKSHLILNESLPQEKILNLKQFIQSQFGQANYLAIRVLVLFQSLVLTGDTLGVGLDKIKKMIYDLKKQILSAMQKLRFQIEALTLCFGFQNSAQTAFNYESCIMKIIQIVLESCQPEKSMKNTLISMLKEEEVNLSDDSRQELIIKIKQNKQKIDQSLYPNQKNPGIIQSTDKQDKFDQNKKSNSALKKKTNSLMDILKSKKTPTVKKTPILHQRTHLQQKTIPDYAVTYKCKQITKSRTIHQSRKCVFIPKTNENSITFYAQKFEHSTQNSMDFVNVSGVQNTHRYMDFSDNWHCQDENMLVRSTPKPIRQTRKFQGINKKLDFSEE